jgi:hypothetical protein
MTFIIRHINYRVEARRVEYSKKLTEHKSKWVISEVNNQTVSTVV